MVIYQDFFSESQAIASLCYPMLAGPEILRLPTSVVSIVCKTARTDGLPYVVSKFHIDCISLLIYLAEVDGLQNFKFVKYYRLNRYNIRCHK